MKAGKIKADFENEAALCAAFIAALPEGWTAYAETAGFDILLVRGADGAQIGVEAKMTLNAKVLMQAVEGIYAGSGEPGSGPDFRAALVPYGTAGAEMKCIARYLGVAVIECRNLGDCEAEVVRIMERYGSGYFLTEEALRKYAESEVKRDHPPFKPDLPLYGGYDWRDTWKDFCPVKRCSVPDYVPDVSAGASGPSQLSEWKIKAIKICIILERRGYLTPKDFAHVSIDRKRWHDMGWIAHATDNGVYVRGRFVAGGSPLDLRAAHPVNFGQIEADWAKWKPKEDAAEFQGAML
ncbi:hypothetical protein OLZ32_27870 [Rhizobium sp. 1AS11]|uniref:hypothetical protein n=1 Tax=Rhizobium acaciae TaxID=2989736 RepID=UPI0022234B94|nr:hypothetical protein [Rhizobium acaciae]MCW1412171.1 hypothetical protein [Rhizobium acaciae]MCW1744186.1 hypothetical protein [Rhizobium acaciae]